MLLQSGCVLRSFRRSLALAASQEIPQPRRQRGNDERHTNGAENPQGEAGGSVLGIGCRHRVESSMKSRNGRVGLMEDRHGNGKAGNSSR